MLQPARGASRGTSAKGRGPWLHHCLVIILSMAWVCCSSAGAQDLATRANRSTPPRQEIALASALPAPQKYVASDRQIPFLGEETEPEHLRGQITEIGESSIAVTSPDGATARLGFSDNLTVFSLTNGSFTDVILGTYVGSVAVRLDGDADSPAARQSASWLHKGLELRIVEEELRGIALGHKKWDLTPESTITHGWVDDFEGRVLSIKYGPTDVEETDVEIPSDVPIFKMSIGDKHLIRLGEHVLAGANQGPDGDYLAEFIFIAQEATAPPL